MLFNVREKTLGHDGRRCGVYKVALLQAPLHCVCHETHLHMNDRAPRAADVASCAVKLQGLIRQSHHACHEKYATILGCREQTCS